MAHRGLLPSKRASQNFFLNAAGQPTAVHWLEALSQIQNAGKMIHIDIVMEDLPILLEYLRPEGLMYRLKCKDREEADFAVKLALAISRYLCYHLFVTNKKMILERRAYHAAE